MLNIQAAWEQRTGLALYQFAPAQGPAGTSITITGANLAQATSVLFDDQTAALTTVFLAPADKSPTSISVAVPAGLPVGTHTLSVQTPDAGTASFMATFTVVAPPALSVTDFKPKKGVRGSEVIITGTGLTAAAPVFVNGAMVSTKIPNNDGTELKITVPNGATSGQITVGGNMVPNGPFTVQSLSPETIPNDGTDHEITLYGTGFTAGSVITIGGKPTSLTSHSATKLTVKLSAAHVPAAGASYPVVITPAAAALLDPASQLTVTKPLPIIGTLSPEKGQVGTSVTIAGKHLTDISAVSVGGTNAEFTAINATTVKFTVPAGAKSGTVKVVNPEGEASSKTFTVEPSPVTVKDMKAYLRNYWATNSALKEKQMLGRIYLRGATAPLSHCPPGQQGGCYSLNRTVRIDSVTMSTLGGRITRMRVFADDNGVKKIYTNARTSISLINYSKRKWDVLGELAGGGESVVIGDIFYPLFSGNRTYIPDDADYTLSYEDADRRSAPLYAGGALSNLIEASLYTDALGVLNREDNGIVSTELASQIPLMTEPIGRNKKAFLLQALRLYGSITRLDERYDTVALRGTDLRRIDRVDLLQRAYIRYGANLNLLTIDPNRHVTGHLNAGWSGVITRVSKPVGTGFQERNAYSKAWNLDAVASVRKLGNFGCDIGLTGIYWHTVNEKLIQNNGYEFVLKPSTLLYYHPISAPENKLFLRFASWNFLNNRDRSFLQIQFGYTIGIGALAESFASSQPQEAANKIQSSPIN